MRTGQLTSEDADRLATRAFLWACAWPVVVVVIGTGLPGLSRVASVGVGLVVGTVGQIAAIRLGGRVRRSSHERGLASLAYALGWIEVVLTFLVVVAFGVFAYALSRSDLPF